MKAKITKFETYLKTSFKKKWHLPGVAFTIFDSEKILHEFTIGSSNLKTKAKLNISDKFCTGSTGKSMLCTAITIFIREKRIPDIWNMTLEEAWSKRIHKDYKKVKVKQLAGHIAGISEAKLKKYNLKSIMEIEKKMKGLTELQQRKKLANIVLKTQPAHTPGKEFDYSNWGYGILGAIVEKWAKIPYWEVIDEAIMKPLGIDASYHYKYGKGYVNGHHIMSFISRNIIPLKRGQHKKEAWCDPSGMVWMSVRDCAKYCQVFMKSFQKKETILKTTEAKMLTKPFLNNYGFGWQIKKENNYFRITHGGRWQMQDTVFVFWPDKNIGLVCCSNIYTSHLRGVVNEFEAIFV